MLFGIPWSELTHLDLCGTKLAVKDLVSLCSACNGPDKTTPKLSALCLSLPSYLRGNIGENLFAVPWLNLERFYLQGSLPSQRDLHEALKANKLPNIIYLGIAGMDLYLDLQTKVESLVLKDCVLEHDFLDLPETSSKLCFRSCSRVSVCLPHVLQAVPPSLISLILRDCGLDKEALSHVIQASDNDRLPNLKLLDITENGLSRSLMDSVTPGVSFRALQELVIDDCPTVSSGWPNLKSLFLDLCKIDSMNNVINAHDQGFFPELRTLCVLKFESYNTGLVRSLSERNIDCHRTFAPDDDLFSSVRCSVKRRYSITKANPMVNSSPETLNKFCFYLF